MEKPLKCLLQSMVPFLALGLKDVLILSVLREKEGNVKATGTESF